MSKILKLSNIEAYSTVLARENIKLITDAGLPGGKDVQDTMLASFLTQYVEGLLTNVLMENRGDKTAPNPQAYEKTSKAYNTLKSQIQNSVADGFNKALQKFSGKDDIDYFCQVLPSPPVANKLVC